MATPTQTLFKICINLFKNVFGHRLFLIFSLTLNSMFSDFLACHIAVGNIDTKTGHMENNYQIPINVRQFFMFFLLAST